MQSRRFIEPNAGNVAFVDEIVQQRKASRSHIDVVDSSSLVQWKKGMSVVMTCTRGGGR